MHSVSPAIVLIQSVLRVTTTVPILILAGNADFEPFAYSPVGIHVSSKSANLSPKALLFLKIFLFLNFNFASFGVHGATSSCYFRHCVQ